MEAVTLDKATVDLAIEAIDAGIEFAHDLLTKHDIELGRTTWKNRRWAETIENDIIKMHAALKGLKG